MPRLPAPEPATHDTHEVWTLADDPPDDEGLDLWPEDPGAPDRTFRS